ncbi:unnamed protein product, partial [Medioppia subpectinata]
INNAKHPVFEAAKSFFQTGFTVKTFLLFLFPQLAHYLDIHFFNEESQQTIANFIKQTKLVNEINSYFGDQSEVDYESVMKMPYLDAFFKEIMRFNCSVNRIDRIAENDCVLNGISIPKGTSIIIPVWALHLDADHYDEPNVFKPERFLPQNESRIKGYTYLPFASGPRNCIGRKFAEMEIKYFMVKILPLFEFKACDQTRNLDFYKLIQTCTMKAMVVEVRLRDSQ